MPNPIAQIAIGAQAPDKEKILTIVLPAKITLATKPRALSAKSHADRPVLAALQ